MGWRRFIRWGIGAAVALLWPLLNPNAYHLDVITTALLYALLALGLNLIVGLTGLLHLGYAAFFGACRLLGVHELETVLRLRRLPKPTSPSGRLSSSRGR